VKRAGEGARESGKKSKEGADKQSGWIMWTWKTEEAVEWSMMTGITSGWIPTPIDAKPHG